MKNLELKSPITCDECGAAKAPDSFYDPDSSEPRCKDCVDGEVAMMGDDPCGKNWES